MKTLVEIDTADLRKDALTIVDRANAIMVTNQEEAQAAFNLRGMAKAFEKKVKDFFAPHKKLADKAHALLCASEKKELAGAVNAITIVDAKLSQYQEAKRKRDDAERKEREDAARKQSEDAVISQAKAAEDAGDHQEAAAILNEPLAVPAIIIPKATKIAGGSFRTEWFAEVVDLKEFVKAVANGAPMLVEPDQIALKKFAASTRGSVKIPGVRFGSKQIPVGR